MDGPVFLLLGFQYRLLTYHSLPITIMHAATLLTDVALLLTLWPKVISDQAPKLWHRMVGRAVPLSGVALSILMVAGPPWSLSLSLAYARLDNMDLRHRALWSANLLNASLKPPTSPKLF